MAVNQKNATENCDELKMKGVRAKGYGQISKMAMLDPDISVEAKGILAYFCSYCGGGNTAFPGRDRIVRDLRINKDTYYKHLKALISGGYLSVEQKAGEAEHPGFRHNIYTIENFPVKFAGPVPDFYSSAMKEAYKKVQTVRDISAAGYGIIPKTVMLAEISVQAKSLYAYLCAFSGQDFSAAPPRDVILAHLNISHNSYNKYMKELCGANLVRKAQVLSGGRFAGFIYYLNQMPEDNTPEIPAIELPQPKIPDARIQTSEPKIPDTQKPDAQKQDTNIPSVNMTKDNIQILSEGQSILPDTDTKEKADEGWIDFRKEKSAILNEIIAEGTIPCRYMSNPLKINAALKLLTEWDIHTDPEYYTVGNGKECVRTYKNFISALSEMLTVGNYTRVRGSKISYAMVYQALVDNHLVIRDDSADLDFFPDDCIYYYIEMSAKQRITDASSYMKSIIWTKIKEAGTRELSMFNYDMNNRQL